MARRGVEPSIMLRLALRLTAIIETSRRHEPRPRALTSRLCCGQLEPASPPYYRRSVVSVLVVRQRRRPLSVPRSAACLDLSSCRSLPLKNRLDHVPPSSTISARGRAWRHPHAVIEQRSHRLRAWRRISRTKVQSPLPDAHPAPAPGTEAERDPSSGCRPAPPILLP